MRSSISRSRPSGTLPLRGHVGAARVRRDREPGRDRDPELGHLRKADALAAEELAPAPGVLVEVEDVAHLREESTLVRCPATSLPAAARPRRTASTTSCSSSAAPARLLRADGERHSGGQRSSRSTSPSRIAPSRVTSTFNPWPRRRTSASTSSRRTRSTSPVEHGQHARGLARRTASTSCSARPGSAGSCSVATSAGMICWFEAGVTDSFGPELAGMRDLLGFLPGSACPALRRRGAAAARLSRARRCRISAGVCGRTTTRRCYFARYRAPRSRLAMPGRRSGVSRRARCGRRRSRARFVP